MVIFVVKGVTHIARNLKIKVARAEKDMTQKALAEAVGISRQTMNAIEQGEYDDLDEASKIVHEFSHPAVVSEEVDTNE